MTAPDRSAHAPFLAVAALIVAGVAYRLVYVFDLVGKIDGDNAVVGLMARHILAGRHYVFFWGQSYMGSLEPYSIAAVAWLVGLNDLVLRGVPLVYGSLYMASFYLLGRRLEGESLGVASLALAALCPPLLAVWSSAPRGGYPEMLFLGQAALLLALRIGSERGSPRAGARRALLLALGLVSGLAFWTHPEAAVFLLVAAAVLLLEDREILRRADPWIAAAAFLAGSAPLWAHQLAHRFDSASLISAEGSGASAASTARTLLVAHLPKLAGVRDLVGAQGIVLGVLGGVVGTMLAAGVVYEIARRTPDLLALVRGRKERAGPEILILLLATLLVLYLPSRYGTWNTQRYLLPLYSALLPLAASAWLACARRSPAVAAVAAVAVLVVFARGAAALHEEFRGPDRTRANLPDVVAFMEAHGIRHGYADHSEALVNTYRSQERVVFLDRSIRRYPIGELEGWNPDSILVRGSGADLVGGLEQLGATYRVEHFGSHTLLHAIAPRRTLGAPLPRASWRVGGAEEALAIDGDPRTRWASHRPQRPGLAFEIDLGAVEQLGALRLDAGAFVHDVARGLRIEGAREDGRWTTLAEVPRPYPGLVVEGRGVRLGPQASVEVVFAPASVRRVRVVQTGEDPRFDWSITEIEAFPPAAPPSPE